MLAEWWESPDGKQRFLNESEAREVCGERIVHRVGKMSKQLRNYRSPQEIFDTYGADALRWYFFANQAPWNSIIYSEKAVKESIPEFLLRLWNVYSFFVIYASIDEFEPARLLTGSGGQLVSADLRGAAGFRPAAERSELDRWVLSELNGTIADVTQRMDAYDNYAACTRLSEFVDGLSNWYVRRSRDRFWSSDRQSADKLDAYWTLYECLLITSKLIAPFTPFLAETMWRNLAGVFADRVPASVHLCDYPACDPAAVDDQLSDQMQLLREIASLGRAARMEAKLKVRQPLHKVEVILADKRHQAWLEAHDALLRDELNVKEVEYTQEADRYINYQVQPNFKRLGPRLGALMPKVKQALGRADAAGLLRQFKVTGRLALQVDGQTVELDSEDIQVRLQAKQGWAAAQGGRCVVVLSTDLTPQLIREGLARDLVRLIQERRKEVNCQYTDRIRVGLVTEDDELRAAIQENLDFIRGETLAVEVTFAVLPNAETVEQTISGNPLELYLTVVAAQPAPDT
jgi:isoleucyl-tRNA synthetase